MMLLFVAIVLCLVCCARTEANSISGTRSAWVAKVRIPWPETVCREGDCLLQAACCAFEANLRHSITLPLGPVSVFVFGLLFGLCLPVSHLPPSSLSTNTHACHVAEALHTSPAQNRQLHHRHSAPLTQMIYTGQIHNTRGSSCAGSCRAAVPGQSFLSQAGASACAAHAGAAAATQLADTCCCSRRGLLLSTSAAAQCSCCALACQAALYTRTQEISQAHARRCPPQHTDHVYVCLTAEHTHAASNVYMHACTKAQNAQVKLSGSAAAPGAAPVSNQQTTTQLLLQPAAAAPRTAGCQQHSRHLLLLHTAGKAAAHTDACAFWMHTTTCKPAPELSLCPPG
jgi:hypothetical protein